MTQNRLLNTMLSMKQNHKKLNDLLKKAGFLDKEISIYLSTLEIGKGTVAEISRKAGINRTTGYVILDILAGKGLVSVSGKEPKQEYVAESPEKLLIFFKKQLEEQKELVFGVEECLPELISLHKKGDRSRVIFYEGKDGLKQVYEDTLTSQEPICAYASVDDVHAALPGYFPDYYKRRARKGIAIRAIFTDNKEGRELSKHDVKELRQSVFVPENKFSFHPEINIYDDKVMIASWREKLGIIIESSEIADAMKKIYELAWAEAKRLDKDISKK